MEAFACEQAKIDSALEAIKVQKATLKEARWNQKQIRLGRNYYPPRPFPKGAGKGDRDRKVRSSVSGAVDLTCKRNVLTRKSEAKVAEEAAEIAFVMTEDHGSGHRERTVAGAAVEAAQVASTVMNQCMGIIDSGATASLGSIDAMEALALQNIEQSGDSKIHLDLDKRPVFKFGNGMSNSLCVDSTSADASWSEEWKHGGPHP